MCLMREWGRIGRAGQTRSVPFPTPQEAKEALDKQRRSTSTPSLISGLTRIPPVSREQLNPPLQVLLMAAWADHDSYEAVRCPLL